MRICLTSIWFPLAMSRYFERAFNRLAAEGDIELITFGPYTGSYIPWAGGMTLPQKYAISPTIPLAMPNVDKIPFSFVEAQLPWKPDLFIQIDAGFHITGRPSSGKNFIVATDPHVLNYDLQRSTSDEFFCMQRCYAKPGDRYLPYAYDPIAHSIEDQERTHDATLIGLHYPNRDRWVNELRALGVNVHYDLGPIYDEARAIYNRGPIGLNWSSRDDLVARVFELLGLGRLAVVNRVPDLPEFFEDGKDLIVFDKLDEAVERVVYYLDNKDEAQAIAAQGHETVRPHTWDARVKSILEMF